MKSAACEAVVLRYVHDIATEEFVNIGVVLFCRERAFVGAKFLPSWTRVTHMFPDADLVHLRRLATIASDQFKDISERWRSELRLVPLPPSVSALVTELAPAQEGGLRQSSVITGVTTDPERTLSELFLRHVGKFLTHAPTSTREDRDVWRGFAERFPTFYIHALQPHVVSSAHFQYDFQHAWQNGCWNAAQPLSLDMQDARTIRDKAATWIGRMRALDVSPDSLKVTFLVGLPEGHRPKAIRNAARDGTDLLREHLDGIAEVIKESEAEKLANKITQDMRHRIEADGAAFETE